MSFETASPTPIPSMMQRLGTLVGKAKPVSEMNDAELAEAGRRSREGGIASRLLMGFRGGGLGCKDTKFPGSSGPVPVRIYTPSRHRQSARPLVVAYHGGGWALGGLDGFDWIAGTVCRDLNAVVVSVDYRLAPTHRFPAAVEDCYDALVWSAANAVQLGVTVGRIGVMGDSAGGNLAAVICLLARDRSGPAIHHQSLLYPCTDLFAETTSRQEHWDAPFLKASDLNRFAHAYLGPDAVGPDWQHSPLRAFSHSGLPPALIQIAGHDPLRDDGLLYAKALQSAGGSATLTDYPAMPHGFASFPYFNRDAKAALRQIVTEQRVALHAHRMISESEKANL